jgi:hypothetical protein
MRSGTDDAKRVGRAGAESVGAGPLIERTTSQGFDDLPIPQLTASIWSCPPGLFFHIVVAIPSVALLYVMSFPGAPFLGDVLAGLALLVAASVWAFRALTYFVSRRRSKAHGNAAWFSVAPLGGVVVLTLLWTSLPLRLRWAASQSAFDNIVEDLQPLPSRNEIVRLSVGDRVGLYRIRHAYQKGDAVIFYEVTGSGFLNDAGFAYLPSGPFAELSSASFEGPRFRHLGGAWYSWTASW